MTMDELLRSDETNGSDLLAAVESIFDQTGIEMKTVLKPKQIAAIAVAMTFGEKYKLPIIRGICELLMELKVSDNGTGRKDLRAILSTKIKSIDASELKRDRLLGGR